MLTTVPYMFPSVPWFQRVAEKAEEQLRPLGVVDTTFVVRVGNLAYRLVFDGFGCTEVAVWEGDEPVDFELAASLADWRSLVEDHLQSLNSLVLADDRFHLRGEEQLGVDNFYRYNASLEVFFGVARSVPTVFRKAA